MLDYKHEHQKNMDQLQQGGYQHHIHSRQYRRHLDQLNRISQSKSLINLSTQHNSKLIQSKINSNFNTNYIRTKQKLHHLNQDNLKILHRINQSRHKNTLSIQHYQQGVCLSNMAEQQYRHKLRQAIEIDQENVKIIKRIQRQKPMTQTVFDEPCKLKQKCDQRFMNNLKQQVATSYQHLINRSQQSRLRKQIDCKNDGINSNNVNIIAVLESMETGLGVVAANKQNEETKG